MHADFIDPGSALVVQKRDTVLRTFRWYQLKEPAVFGDNSVHTTTEPCEMYVNSKIIEL